MSHTVVKLLEDNDGYRKEEPVWCLSVIECGDNCTLCTGEFYGYGAGITNYKVKEVEKGGITCKSCLNKIKEIKSIKL